MITPAYAPTATERVLPRLALDFTTASLDARVTVTRALNTATRVNSSGLIETINANLPRFDYDPITKVCKGLLIEESRTQTARASDLMSQWSKSDTIGQANVVASPSGAQDADLIYPSSSGNNRQVYIQSTTAPTSGSVAISVFAADAGLNWIIIYGFDSVTPLAWFDVANGVKGTVVAGWTSEIEPYENGFYRCSVVGTAVAGGYITYGVANADNSLAATASGTNGVYFWGAQVEAGAFKTSYIPNPDITNGSSVTRNADVVDMTGTNFTDWYNASEGAFVANYSRIAIKRYSRVFAASNVAETDQVTIISGLQAVDRENGNVQVPGQATYLYPGDTPAAGQIAQFCLSYKSGNSAASLNASTVSTNAATFANPAPTQFNIGSVVTSGQYLNGHVRKILYWPQVLTNAEIRAFAKTE